MPFQLKSISNITKIILLSFFLFFVSVSKAIGDTLRLISAHFLHLFHPQIQILKQAIAVFIWFIKLDLLIAYLIIVFIISYNLIIYTKEVYHKIYD